MKPSTHYPGFGYAASELSAFILCFDVFVISLKDERVIRHMPKDIVQFRLWLVMNDIRDVEDGLEGRI